MKKILIILLAIVSLYSCQNKNQEKSDNTKNVSNKKSLLDSLANFTPDSDILTAELLWKFGRLFDAQLSPDGKTVIYCVKRYNAKTNKGYTDIFSIDIATKKVTQLTDFVGAEVNPRWSADGKQIYFLAAESGSMQIWKMNADGTNKKQLSKTDGDISSFELSPKNNKLFFTKDVKVLKTTQEIYPDLPKANAKIITNLMYRHWDHWTDEKFSHIFVADLSTKKVSNEKDIMPNEKWDSPLSPWFDNTENIWSADGKYVAYTCKKLYGKDYTLSTNSDIYLYNVETGKTKNITEGMPGYDKYPRFSPDGKKVAWQSMATPGYESDKDRLFVMNLETGEKEYITKNFDQNVKNLIWDNDNKTIYFISGIHATYQIYKVNTETKEFTQITKGVHNYNSFSKAGNVIIGERMSMSQATEIYKISENGDEEQLTFTNKNIYDKVKMGEVKSRWLTTTDNKKMLVWVIYPPNFDKNKKYPALLYCQGGPQSAVSQFWSYRWNFQMMAANDYIIVAPNRRGLPTFGQEWNAEISGDYGGQNMLDYFTAIDSLKTEPYIDENRLGAVGASYGGFSVYWLAGHHNKRFKAFISHCGIFNFESQYTATDEMFFVNHDFGGAYWDKNNAVAQKSYATSPHNFVKNWDTPILIITGGYDFRIPYTQSMEAFNAAQLLGVESELLFFPEESHFVLQPQNGILWQHEFFKFLDKHLKN